MKKWAVCLGLIAFIGVIIFAFANFSEEQTAQTDYLRIHIRANSNSQADQAVKYEVRDAVVAYLTPIVAQCESKEEAIKSVSARLDGAVKEAERTLAKNGYFYGARASIKKEQFPTRVYEGVTLAGGVYDALIVELGSGEGDNWWCVVYPPLCFTAGNGNIVYKSKIAEIIRKFFGN